MSGMSLADMRRIGLQRNAEASQAPAKPGLLDRLPKTASGGAKNASPRASSPVRQMPAPAPMVAAPLPAEVEPKQVEALLRTNTQKHLLAGLGAGGLVGVAAGGLAVGLPLGAVAGGSAGYFIASRTTATPKPAEGERLHAVGGKQAAAMLEPLKLLVKAMGHHKPSLKLVVSSHVRFDVAMSPKLQGPLTLTIGLALLKVLDQAQVRALFAHRYCLARAEGRKAGDVVTTQTLGRVRGVADGMAKRPSFLQLTKPSTLQAAAAEAEARWAQDTRSLYETADRDALMVCSGHELVGALLTEGLLAASNRERLERGDPQGPWLESIAMPWQPAARDAALRLLSAHQAPNPDSPNAGVGPALFERIARLGTDVPVPVLPSPTPAIDAFDPKAVQRMARAVIVGKPHKADAKPKKARKLKSKGKAEAADTVATADAAQPAEGTHPSLPSARPAKKSLFKKLTAKRRSGVEQQIDALPQAVAPLYEADALYRDDRHVGIEAYAALVHAHPRWSLARLRLGEAQVEAGFSDGVQNLLTCAETLPSALPTILERLGGAMAMVSPLDEETLRQTIDSLSQHAEAIAEERRGIDLDRLEPHALDTEDQACLRALFSASPGLREAWVFQLPVAGMPEVPHHAVIALAPTVETADAADVAQQITEHAAIIGTLVVHIETGRPTGALSDALAAHASFWRLASQ